ncbi:lipase/acylhydrolase [Cohnella abietis]|uniref:Lipase/acylhydrolase n=1 Tax=Cohnella abietis TaxID=2507935 RepID=A0A3T1D495_9BACL|nr:lipase/acylhydrolase [Cohnella abietis]
MELWEKLKRGEQGFIVCIGDSITEQNYHANGKLNYVGQLNEMLLNVFGRQQLLLNAGVSDDTTWGVLNRLNRDVLRFQPDLITLMIGMNDSMRGIEQLPEFKNNLLAIIAQARAVGSELILLTPNTINLRISENAIRDSYPHYIHAIREIATSEQIPLCDVYEAFEERIHKDPNSKWTLMNDCIHPNEYGHDFIAQALFRFFGFIDSRNANTATDVKESKNGK